MATTQLVTTGTLRPHEGAGICWHLDIKILIHNAAGMRASRDGVRVRRIFREQADKPDSGTGKNSFPDTARFSVSEGCGGGA